MCSGNKDETIEPEPAIIAATPMPEITLADLIAWEPRLRPVSVNGRQPLSHAGRERRDSLAERELSWAVTVRASPPMLPNLRGGELVIVPSRVLAESGVSLEMLLSELSGRGVAGIVLDISSPPPTPLPVLVADPLAPDLESDINRLLTERRGEFYRAGTELSRLLTSAASTGAELPDVLAIAATFLEVQAAVTDSHGATVASTSPEALPAKASRPDSRGWQDGRLGVRLASGETLWLGPVSPERRALVRLASERIAVAVEAALRRAADARPRGPARATALAALLTGAAGDPVRTGLVLGLAANGRYRVALASPETDATALVRALASIGIVHEAGTIDRAHAALIELRGDAAGMPSMPPMRHRDPVPDRSTSRPHRGWLAVSSAGVGTASLPAITREARFVAALLAAGLIPGPVARFDMVNDLGAYRLLFHLWGTPQLAEFTREALGDLAARDRRGTLRKTLLAYLEAGGSHVAAAARLGVHRNTLAYRLKQIAHLTRRDPTDPANHLVLHLALLASALPPAVP